jgi:hypothetical protein
MMDKLASFFTSKINPSSKTEAASEQDGIPLGDINLPTVKSSQGGSGSLLAKAPGAASTPPKLGAGPAFAGKLADPAPGPSIETLAQDAVAALGPKPREQRVLLALYYAWGGGKATGPALDAYYGKFEDSKQGLGDGNSKAGLPAAREFNERVKSLLLEQLPEEAQQAYRAAEADSKKNTASFGAATWQMLKTNMQLWLRGRFQQAPAKPSTASTSTSSPSSSSSSSTVSSSTAASTSSTTATNAKLGKPAAAGGPNTVSQVSTTGVFHSIRNGKLESQAPENLAATEKGKAMLSCVGWYMACGIPDTNFQSDIFSPEQLKLLVIHGKDCWNGAAGLKVHANMDAKSARLVAARRDLTDAGGKRMVGNTDAEQTNRRALGCSGNGYDRVADAKLPGKQVSLAARAPLLIAADKPAVNPVHLELGSQDLDRASIRGRAKSFYDAKGRFNSAAYAESMRTECAHIRQCADGNPGHELVFLSDSMIADMLVLDDLDAFHAITIAAQELARTVIYLKRQGIQVYSTDVHADPQGSKSAGADKHALFADALWDEVHKKMPHDKIVNIGRIPNAAITDNTILVSRGRPDRLAGSGATPGSDLATDALNRNRLLNVVHAISCAATNAGLRGRDLGEPGMN